MSSKNKLIYIFIFVIFSVLLVLLGWYLHKPDKIFTSILGSTDDYQNYVSGIDKICPFVGTTTTSECLDKEINQQEQFYNSLSKNLLTTAEKKYKEGKISQNGDEVLVTSNILSEIPEYNKERNANIVRLCGLKNVLIAGTAIMEESRKCFMYYNAKDIQVLQQILFDFQR